MQYVVIYHNEHHNEHQYADRASCEDVIGPTTIERAQSVLRRLAHDLNQDRDRETSGHFEVDAEHGTYMGLSEADVERLNAPDVMTAVWAAIQPLTPLTLNLLD